MAAVPAKASVRFSDSVEGDEKTMRDDRSEDGLTEEDQPLSTSSDHKGFNKWLHDSLSGAYVSGPGCVCCLQTPAS